MSSWWVRGVALWVWGLCSVVASDGQSVSAQDMMNRRICKRLMLTNAKDQCNWQFIFFKPLDISICILSLPPSLPLSLSLPPFPPSFPPSLPPSLLALSPSTDSHDHVSYMPLRVSFPDSHGTCAKCGNETLVG